MTPQAPVDFEVFAHYSGHSSYTKGLLLVDRSGRSGASSARANQVMELTAEDCRLMAGGTDAMMRVVDGFPTPQHGLQLQLCYSSVFNDSGPNSGYISPIGRF